MKRNGTICGLSRGMVVVEAHASGGTFDAGNKCLEQKKPLFVVEFSHVSDMPEGNKKLIEAEGYPLSLETIFTRVWPSFN